MTNELNAEDIVLPELSDTRIGEIEATLFAQIAQERSASTAAAERVRARSARRGRIWMGAAGAAAIVAIAAVIAPSLLSGTGGNSVSSLAVQPAIGGNPPFQEVGSPESLTDTAAGSSAGDTGLRTQPDASAREVIANASATVRVDDARSAATALATAAVAAGGYVESMSIGGSPTLLDGTPRVGGSDRGDLVDPGISGAWITVRVPAEHLLAALADLAEVGEVTASQVDRRDVTTEAVDVRARLVSLEASVARLTDLMRQASSTADLIAAESALAARQSELESLRQQLTWLESHVEMSTLSVTLTEASPTIAANPTGFGDGFAAGWNGLVASLNGVVVGIGFLLPWLAIIAAGGLIVWAMRRLVRRRRRRGAVAPPE